MTELTRSSARRLRELLTRGETSSVEILEAHLEAIDVSDGDLGCFLRLNPAARGDAELADARIRAGDDGPLTGIPVAIKDNLSTAGLETTCASQALRGFVPLRDATAVARLRAAGAVLLGKTNLDEFSMGSSTENSAFGPTRNPHAPDRVPGGSSGGSAAAVAAGFCPVSLGSDTGGSIRQPAAFCGVVGLKPTYGRVSRSGLVAYASSLDQIGPISRTVEDAANALGVIAGSDDLDSTCADWPVPDFARAGDDGVDGLRVGLPREYFPQGLDPEVRGAIDSAVAVLEREGARVEEVSLPHTRYAIPTYYLVATAEASSNLARYDAVRYGPRADAERLVEMYRTSRGRGFGEEVKRRIMLGTYALSAGYHDEFYGKAQRVRTLLCNDFQKVLDAGIDLLLTPPSPTPAFRLGEKSEEPLAMYLSDVYTVTANLAGLPGLVVPAGRTRSGLPLGAQFLAGHFREETLFRAGSVMERAFPRPEVDAGVILRDPRSTLAVALMIVIGASTPPVEIAAAEPEDASTGFVQINSELRVTVIKGRRLMLEVVGGGARDVEAIARRFAPGQEEAIRAFNGDGAATDENPVRVPLELLSPEARALVLRSLFPQDRGDGGDWLHVARSGVLPTYDEGLWQVASWFTGNGSGFPALMDANGLDSPELRKDQVVRIPAAMLHPAFRARLRSDDGTLEYGVDDRGAFAAYRLQHGEALYSAVVVRFTGRTGAEDVGEITEEILARSDIGDPRDIPVHFEVKIPLSLLEPDYLPESHPRRVEAEAQRAELAMELVRKPVAGTAGGLRGSLIIVDPGHGGRDLGTMNNGIWEHDYVYDVACRLRQKLESRTSATVFMTLEDEETGCAPSSGDKLVANRQGTIQTVPPFLARKDGESQVGVNLRWYLANSVYRKALKDGYDQDRVVFVSLHADARHSSLSGVMVYVPAAGYRTKTYGSTSKTYSRFKEVREKPHVNFSHKERVRSEAVSRKYADEIVESFRVAQLPVQPYQPVRDKVIRGKSKWVPAVLRGNQVPTKVLIEMVNLSNREDATLLASAAERDRLAEALVDSLHRHFGESPERIASQGAAR